MPTKSGARRAPAKKGAAKKAAPRKKGGRPQLMRTRVQALIRGLDDDSDRVEVLAGLALDLAKRIDDGVEDRYLASVAKELRATVDALTTEASASDAFERLERALSATVGNAKKS